MSTCWPSQSLSEASPSTFHLHFIYQSVSPSPHISSISKEAWDIKSFSVSACCRSQKNCCSQFSSVSRSVVSDSLRFHGLQNARLPCPSPVPKTCSNWCPLNRWCHPTISSSAIPFSFCFQSFLALGSFPMNHFFTSGGQSIGASISASTFQWLFRTDFLQDWLVWSPCCPRDSQESSSTPQFKSINSSVLSFLHGSTLTSIHDYWKNYRFYYIDLVGKVMSFLFNMLSRLGYQDLFNLSMLSLTTKLCIYHNWKRHMYPSLLKHYLQ